MDDETSKWLAEMDAKWENLRSGDAEAKKSGRLVGRYIAEPFADGKAIYVIVKESKTRVRIRVVTGIGDDWRIPYWGDEASIDKGYALHNIAWRDNIDALFRKKDKKRGR